jgi:glycine oxidase
VEDAGFDTAVHQRDLDHLRSLAAKLLPALASGREAPLLEAWAGLRPATPDGLPVLGRIGSSSEFVATGHFRNGILLAPATAVLLADLLEGRPPAVDLSAFSPGRFPAR